MASAVGAKETRTDALRRVRARLTASLALILGLVLVSQPVLGADTDGDLLKDWFENKWGQTSATDPDTDGDGVVDSAEDPDGDRLGNLGEQRLRLDPRDRDTDGDGKLDGNEDHDHDGITNAREQDQRKVPSPLLPSLAAAPGDVQPDRKRCQTWNRDARVTTCVFGASGSDVRLLLVGDSHATMYLTPLKHLASERGWRLETMLKSACSAFLGLNGDIQQQVDDGRSCRRWKREVIDRLAASPPDLVIFVHTPRYKLYTAAGKRIPKAKWPGEWRRAASRTLERIPGGTSVLLLGHLPRNLGNPLKCLRKHRSNISACVSRRVPASARDIDVALKQAAAATDADYRTLYPKICSYDPCPLVQGRVLMWRDKSHLSDSFAKQLAPSVGQVVLDALE